MPSSELFDHVDPVIVAVIAIMFAALTFSERIANLSGKFRWIGGLARWWSERQVRKVRRDIRIDRARRRLNDEAYASLEDRYTELDRKVVDLTLQMQKQRDAHDDELEAARLEHREEIRKTREEHHSEMSVMRRELEGKNNQIVVLLQYIHTQRTKAAQQGYQLDPIPERHQSIRRDET